jgi:RimJ/RimL family protein N-acetyltransferase
MQFISTPISKPIVLHEQNGLALSVSSQADPQTVSLLTQTLYGTDGIRYRQTGQAHRIEQLSDPLFFQLYNSHQTLIGLYCLDKRPVGFRGEPVQAYYGRYLAVSADQQGKGFGQLLKATAVEYVQARQSDPYLFYSYIEAKNTRSMAASYRAGFTSVAQLSTYLFRRFTPRPDRRVRPLLPAESALAHQLVADQYAQYGFQHFARINAQRPFFVLEEEGRVVAGVQASPIQWELVHLPGQLGSLFRYVAPHVPGLRRFFNPASQLFLTLEGVCVAPGRADLLAPLLESVMSHYNIHTAMWQIDERDPLRSLLATSGMGPLSGFQAGVTTHVMAKAIDLPASITLARDPVYVSSFDYS